MIYFMVLSEYGSETVAFIYDKHFKKMLFMANQILGKNRGEDVVQDVFMKLIKRFENNIDDLRDKKGQYFVIIVKNHSFDVLKKARVVELAYEDELFDDALLRDKSPIPEELVINNERLATLTYLIRQLKPAMREILEYSSVLKYSNADIAKVLGISESAVSSRLFRARQKLKEMIEESENKNDENQ